MKYGVLGQDLGLGIKKQGLFYEISKNSVEQFCRIEVSGEKLISVKIIE